MGQLTGQSQLRKNIFSGSFTAAGGIVVSILAYPLYLHFLGADLYGLWTILAVIIYFSSIGNFGIDEALVKYIAEEYEKKNIKGIIAYTSTGFNLLVVNGLCIYVIVSMLEKLLQMILHLNAHYSNLLHNIFPYVILLSIFILLVNYINSILKGLGRFDQASYILLSGRVLALVVSVLFFVNGYKIWGLYWGQLLSFLFVLVVSSVFIYRKIGFYYNPIKHRKKLLVNLFKFGGTITVARIISMLLEPFIKIIIARFIGLAEVSYFEIANKIVLQIRSLFERGISAIMPEVSRLSVSARNAKAMIADVMKKIYRVNAFAGLVLFIVLFIIAESILKLWLSENYNIAIAIAFKIVILGYLANLISVPIYYYFMGIGKVKYCFYNHAIQAILNCLLIIIAILLGCINFTLVTAVYAISIAISAIILMYIYYRSVCIRS